MTVNYCYVDKGEAICLSKWSVLTEAARNCVFFAQAGNDGDKWCAWMSGENCFSKAALDDYVDCEAMKKLEEL